MTRRNDGSIDFVRVGELLYSKTPQKHPDDDDPSTQLVCIQRTLSPAARRALTAKVDRIR